MLETLLSYFGLTKAGAVGAGSGAAFVFLRRRDAAAAWLAISGLLVAAVATRATMRWLKLPPDLELATAAALASAGVVLANRVLHLLDSIDWDTVKQLWPWRK